MSQKAIQGLKPALIWEQFYNITQAPRPSKKEGKILEYIKKFAEEHKFKYDQDKTGNIVIRVPATPGYEKSPAIVLQGHVDMVCEKNKGTKHNFETDPIKVTRDGEWITADGTTLGADNGIGLAAGFAIALDKKSVHGPLELLNTVDEETGLTGANGLEPGFIKGKTLLNLDSEEDGCFYVGCSGGQDTVGIFDLETARVKKDLVAYELMITGLKGGHSGLDIQNGRANAIQLLARLLKRLNNFNVRISSLSGGSLRNAIPREAEAVILIDQKDRRRMKKVIDNFVADTLLEYAQNDPGLVVQFTKKKNVSKTVFQTAFAKKILNVLVSLPHGIMAMSPAIPGLVETSTNVATVETADGKLKIGTSQRSSIESAKNDISDKTASVFQLGGASKIVTGDGYPGWQPDMDSKILHLGKKIFKQLFKSEAEIKAIHAGLECGILGDRYPGLDMVSFGPTIQGAHSPDERVNIKAVEKFYKLVKEILKAKAEGK